MKNKNRDISYKLIIILLILGAALIVGSFVSMNILIRNVQTARSLSEKPYSGHYAFICTDDDDDFWRSVYDGAKSRGEELGVYVQDFDENLTADYSTEELMRIAIDAGVDGIITDGSGYEQMAILISEASNAGIPVVTVMNDCAESKRVCYVSLSSYAMGRQYGERIMKHVPASHKEDIRVDVVMGSDTASSGQSLVVSGIFDVFKDNGLGDQLKIDAIYIDNTTAFRAEEDIRDIFLNGELPDAIVGLSSIYTRCLFQAAVDYNKVGDVYIYGFGDSEDILDAVSKNIVEATLSASTSEMGASAVQALDEYIKTGYVSEYLSQDTELIMTEQAQILLSNNEENAEKDN